LHELSAGQESESQIAIIESFLDQSDREELSGLEFMFTCSQRFRLVKPFARPLAKLLSLRKRDRLSHDMFVGCIATVIYPINYGLLLYFSPALFGPRIADQLSFKYFNPYFLVANYFVALFSAWFVRTQSRKLASTIKNIADQLVFPREDEWARAVSTGNRLTGDEVLYRLFWAFNSIVGYDKSNPSKTSFRTKVVTLALCALICVATWVLVRDFPINENWNMLLYLMWFALGGWLITTLTWTPPAKCQGITEVLWIIYRSCQPFVCCVFSVSIAVSELTFSTFISSMERAGFFNELQLLPTLLLKAEVYVGYAFLFILLGGLAHITLTSSIVVIYLCGKKYLVTLDPLDEHGCGGLGPTGELVERNAYGLTFAAFVILLSTFIVYPVEELAKPFYLQITSGFAILVMFSYLLPLCYVRKRVRDLKQIWFEKLKNSEEKRRNGYVLSNLSPEELRRMTKELEANQRAYEMIRNIKEWPGTAGAVTRVFSGSLSPFITLLVRLLMASSPLLK